MVTTGRKKARKLFLIIMCISVGLSLLCWLCGWYNTPRESQSDSDAVLQTEQVVATSRATVKVTADSAPGATSSSVTTTSSESSVNLYVKSGSCATGGYDVSITGLTPNSKYVVGSVSAAELPGVISNPSQLKGKSFTSNSSGKELYTWKCGSSSSKNKARVLVVYDVHARQTGQLTAAYNGR